MSSKRPLCLSLTDEQIASVMNTARLVPHKFRAHFLDFVSDLLMTQANECSGWCGSDGIHDGLVFDATSAALAWCGAAVARAGHG
jgi:hypothetical protein